LLSGLFLASYCPYGFNLADEGIPLYGGVRVMNGQVPLVDFWGYMPGRYYLYASIFMLLGKDIAIVRITLSFLSAVVPLMAFLVSRRFTGNLGALVPVILILAGPGLYCTRFIPILIMCNIYLLGCFLLQQTSLKNFLYCLARISMTFFFKFEIGLISAWITSRQNQPTGKRGVIGGS